MTALAMLTMWVAGCEEAPPEKVERIRAIKPYYVSEPAGGDLRRYSGTISASDSSSIGFAVSGTVKTVIVNSGDQVKKGQILATLDAKNYQLDVQAAKSELKTKQAELKQVRQDIERKRELFKKGWIAKAAFEKTAASLDVAEEALNLSRSRLGLAERELTKTRLTAPFDGVIAERSVDPFTETKPGDQLFRIDTKGTYEVDVSISDSVINRVSVGALVTIDVANVANCGCMGRIIQIGAQAGAANAVPVKATISQSSSQLLPGMAVDVGVVLAREGEARGFLIPLVAIAAGDDKARGYVFKFDQENGVVRKAPIIGEAGIDGNLIGISQGVEPGYILAAAGVSFLRDGQRVKLLGQ